MSQKILSYLVLVAALLQVYIPYQIINQGFFNENAQQMVYIQPAGYVFAIWGLIYLFATLYAIYQVIPSRNNPILEQNRLYALILFLGSSLWLYASNFSQTWLWVTVPILIAMACLAYEAISVKAIDTHKTSSWLESFFSWQALIIYTAWVTTAQFVNVAAMISQYQLVNSAFMWSVLNIVILLIAALVLYRQSHKLNFSPWHTGVVVWASIGIVINNLSNNGEVLVIVLSALLAVVFTVQSIIHLKK